MKKVFISYSQEDAAYAHMLRNKLAESGISVTNRMETVFSENLWKDSIKDMINKSEGILVLLSENSKDSKWISFEIGVSWSSSKKIVLLSTLKNNDDLPTYLKNFQRINISDNELSEVVNRISTL